MVSYEEEYKTSYFDDMFKETEEEKEINKLIDEENKAWEETEAYKVHYDKIMSYLQQLSDLRIKRHENAREKRVRLRKKNNIDVTKPVEKKEHDYSKVEELASQVNNLTWGERIVFNSMVYDELPKYNNPQTTKDDINELHHLLVQTCIDFINDKKLKDIDVVSFSADSLQESSKFGEWCPSTDSYIEIEGYQMDEKGNIIGRALMDKQF